MIGTSKLRAAIAALAFSSFVWAQPAAPPAPAQPPATAPATAPATPAAGALGGLNFYNVSLVEVIDILAQKRVLEFLKHVNQARKTTILLTSHNLIDIQKLCPRVIIINRGRLVSDGRLADLSQVLQQKKIIRIEVDPKLLQSEEIGDGNYRGFLKDTATPNHYGVVEFPYDGDANVGDRVQVDIFRTSLCVSPRSAALSTWPA